MPKSSRFPLQSFRTEFLTAGVVALAAAPAFAQSIDVEVSSDLETMSFEIAGATPSSVVLLAIDFPQCQSDVNGDRVTDDSDVAIIRESFGPVLNPQRKVYDLNNDGFVNEQDAIIATGDVGCSDIQSAALPGCGIVADINVATMRRFTVATDGNGEALLELPLNDHFDRRLYAQAIDPASCQISPLKTFFALGSFAYTAPESTISALAMTDFMEVVPNGLVQIETNLGSNTFTKTSAGQSDGSVQVTPGDLATLTLQETPASFLTESGVQQDGIMIGTRDVVALPEGEFSAGRIEAMIQPFAASGMIGNQVWPAPFHGLFDIFQPYQNAAYQPFKAEVGVLTTAESMRDVLSYYDVNAEMLEHAEAAIFVRVDQKTNLNVGEAIQHGFGLNLGNFPNFAAAPFLATRHLTDSDSPGPGVASLEVMRFDGKLISLHVTGTLEQGDHLFLLSSRKFNVKSGKYNTNAPVMVATAAASDGECGTPAPPANPPAVGGTCEPSLGLLWSVTDCILTGNYSVSATVCGDVGPFLAATSGGAGGVTVGKDLETHYKGSATVSVEFGGVTAEVGEEVEHTEGITTGVTLQPGANGCGQNIAWYLYVKFCVKRWSISYHTWEGWLPDWCGGCCHTVYSACKAGETITTEICDRDC